MRLLNCNRINGNIINESTAKIMFYSKFDTIANIYNESRVEKDGKLDHFCIDEIDIEKEYAREFYIALWWTFFKENKELAKEITAYDKYDDGMPEGVANSTAKVFEIMKKYGVAGLGSNCKEFLILLRDKRNLEKRTTLFEQYKSKAEYIIRTNNGREKSELIEIARQEGGIELVKILSLLYDKKLNAITEALYLMQLKEIKNVVDKKEKNQRI